MNSEMTSISKGFYDMAVSDILTIQDAVQYLEKEAKIRSLCEKLEKFSHGQDLRKVLVQGLLENDPKRKKDAVERRVRGWLSDNGKVSSIKKQDAIEVCFILNLSIEEADQFVTMISEESLHYRNPDEIVYIFALRHGMSYLEAVELNEEMKGILSKAKESKTPSEDSFTPLIRKEVSALRDKKELAEYLEHAAERLGRFHNNAYKEFIARMEILGDARLESCLEDEIEEKHFTIRDILREYLFEKNILYAKERERESRKKEKNFTEEEKFVFTKVRENVSSNWPDETTLSKMKSRKTDVTRKVLILLFLATDKGVDWNNEEWGMRTNEKGEYDIDSYVYEDLDHELTKEEAFEELYSRLNDMLSLCGFMPLDPRSPFDWLIIYCICVEDMFDVDLRMRGIFREMFGEREDIESGN